MRLVLLLAVAACHPVPGSYARLKPRDVSLEGPRVITVLGECDGRERLISRLTSNGFRVSRAIPHVESELKTRYVLNVAGNCWRDFLFFEIYDSRTNERVWTAQMVSNDECPDYFLSDVMRAITRMWPTTELPDGGVQTISF